MREPTTTAHCLPRVTPDKTSSHPPKHQKRNRNIGNPVERASGGVERPAARQRVSTQHLQRTLNPGCGGFSGHSQQLTWRKSAKNNETKGWDNSGRGGEVDKSEGRASLRFQLGSSSKPIFVALGMGQDESICFEGTQRNGDLRVAQWQHPLRYLLAPTPTPTPASIVPQQHIALSLRMK